MKIDNMSYRQWQKRNTEAFKKLTKVQQKTVRDHGYRNIGWQKVQDSWKILQQLDKKPASLFDIKLKHGDLEGALDQSILVAEQAQKVAKDAIASLGRKRQLSKRKTQATLKKYQLL